MEIKNFQKTVRWKARAIFSRVINIFRAVIKRFNWVLRKYTKLIKITVSIIY